MTMRLLVLVLLLGNGAYFAWSHGMLRAYGLAPVQQSEPQRLENQLYPEALQLLTVQEVQALDVQRQAAKLPKTCLQAGPFDAAQTAALRTALEAHFPAATWQMDAKILPARWIIYLGKFPSQDALVKKKQELLSIRLTAQPLLNPDLELGLSLGNFETQDAANATLLEFNKRGLRTGRVVMEYPEMQSHSLRVTGLTDALKPKLADIRGALAGRSLVPCEVSSR